MQLNVAQITPAAADINTAITAVKFEIVNK